MTNPQRKPYTPHGYAPPHKTAGGGLRTSSGVVIGGAIEAKPAHNDEPASNEPSYDDDNGSPAVSMLAAISGLFGFLIVAGGIAGGLGLLGGAIKRVVEGWAFHVQHNLSFGAGFDELLRQLNDNPMLAVICGGFVIAIVITLFVGNRRD